MATVETWISEHDKVCAERYRLLIGVVGTAGLILIAVAGWGLNQVHTDQIREGQMLQSISAQIAHTSVMVAPSVVTP